MMRLPIASLYVTACPMELEYLKDTLITLFIAIDPPGLVPIFLALTATIAPLERWKIAKQASFIAFSILAAVALGGAPLLTAIGISIPAFRIAGGLMLFYIAWEMIFNRREPRKSESAETSVTRDQIQNIAVFPLAIPLIAGPGSITATILIASKAESIVDQATLIGALAAMIFCCWVMFRLSSPIDRLLGFTGRTILERLLGVLLAALAVQTVGEGMMAFHAL